MKLFEPLKIKRMKLKNRLVMAPMQLVLGLTSKRARAYYLERAKGGVGAIIIAATSVDLLTDDKAWGRPDGVAKFMDTMQSFTDEVHKTGAKIGIQLWHGNSFPAGNGSANVPGSKPVAPSAKDGMKELTHDEIRSIIEKFAMASNSILLTCTARMDIFCVSFSPVPIIKEQMNTAAICMPGCAWVLKR